MKWLHLSDLHFKPKQDTRSTLQARDKLKKYLQDNRIKVDHLFITGDYRHAKFQGDSDEDVAGEVVNYILEIAETVKVPFENIHLIPGNHDLTRFTEEKKIKKLEEIKEGYDIEHGTPLQQTDIELLLERFSFFKLVLAELKKRNGVSVWSDTLYPIHAYRCFNDFSLLYLNTNLFCNSKDDRGRLLISNYDLYQTLEKIQAENKDQPIIVLAHHGIDNFADMEKREIEKLFKDYPVKLYLCGDAHKPWQRGINNVPEITMGCLTSESGVCTVFSVGELLHGQFSIEAHQWDTEFGWGTYSQFNTAVRELMQSSPYKKTLAEIITDDRPAVPVNTFIGRETTIQEIEEALAEESKIVLLNGLGGMGKSEICRELFERYSVRCGTNLVKQLGWINYRDTLKNSFFKRFPVVQAMSEDGQAYWYQVKQQIDRIGSDLLLFVDDANEMTDSEAIELSQLGCKMIVTSRSKLERMKPIEIGRLSPEDCVQLYKMHSGIDDESFDDVIRSIVTLAAGHTLSIELLAKTQLAAGLSTEELLENLRATGFDLSEISENIKYHHNPEQNHNAAAYARFIEHMEKIFDIAKINEVPEELDILQLFSLLAPNTPVAVKTIKAWFELSNLETLNSVIQKGWLIRSTQGGVQTISMHPVISAVVHRKKIENETLLDIFFRNVAKDLYLKEQEIFVNKLDTYPHAVSVVNAVDRNSVNFAALLHNVAFISTAQGDYSTVLEWYNRALKIREKVLGKEHPSTATTYNNIASVYDSQGDHGLALEWYDKALKIREKVLGKEHSDTATTYNNIAGVYNAQGDHGLALKWYDKALKIREKVLGKEHPSTATTYNNIAGVYYAQGDYDKALEWYDKALKIREKVLGKEHPSTATTYNNIAGVYNAQGDYDKALEWYDKALKIREKVLGKEHSDTAATYNNIAGVYNAQGDHGLALEWYDKALKISEKVLGKEHPSTATTYNNIAGVYNAQGDYDKALEWYDKALKIREKVLGKEHSDTATTYNNIAGVYNAQGDHGLALKWYDKALKIREKVLGKEHPSTATTYNNIAGVYYAQGDYDKALEWYDKALKIREKVLGKEHPDTAVTYNNIGVTYAYKHEYEEALMWLHKALKIFIKRLGFDHPYTVSTAKTIDFITGLK